jgi:L-methionine (R)-S-oxide reductase
MRDVLEAIMGRFNAETGTIHRLEGDVLLLEAEIGLPPPVVAMVRRVPIGKGMAGLAAKRNEPVSSCNIQVDTTGDVRPGARQTGVNVGIGVRHEYEYGDAEVARLLDAAAHIRF